MRKKTWLLMVSLLLAAVCIIGGTLAWLTASTDAVTNTFTTSNITITLTETTGSNYKMVPGYTINKDPKVTVKAGSEECYLFVKLEKSSNFDDFLTYEMADGWTQLADGSDVYYRVVRAENMGNDYSVLKGNQVSVKDTVTKETMNGLTEKTYPTLTVTAYASQLHKSNTEIFTALEAWNNVNPDSGN